MTTTDSTHTSAATLLSTQVTALLTSPTARTYLPLHERLHTLQDRHGPVALVDALLLSGSRGLAGGYRAPTPCAQHLLTGVMPRGGPHANAFDHDFVQHILTVMACDSAGLDVQLDVPAGMTVCEVVITVALVALHLIQTQKRQHRPAAPQQAKKHRRKR